MESSKFEKKIYSTFMQELKEKIQKKITDITDAFRLHQNTIMGELYISFCYADIKDKFIKNELESFIHDIFLNTNQKSSYILEKAFSKQTMVEIIWILFSHVLDLISVRKEDIFEIFVIYDNADQKIGVSQITQL